LLEEASLEMSADIKQAQHVSQKAQPKAETKNFIEQNTVKVMLQSASI
jgi:hypothetical protein